MAGFWRGPITTHQQAGRILKVTGRSFAVMSVIVGLLEIRSPAGVCVALALFLMAIALSEKWSTNAAYGFILIWGVALIGGVVTSTMLLARGDQNGGSLALVSIIWLLPFFAAIRALMAAQATRRLVRSGNGS